MNLLQLLLLLPAAQYPVEDECHKEYFYRKKHQILKQQERLFLDIAEYQVLQHKKYR
jgi:hypothetical protein